MVITKFLQPEFNRVFQEKLINTKFADFGESLVTAFQGIVKHVKIHAFPMGVMEGHFFSAGNSCLIASFRCLIVGNHQK